MRIGMLSSKTRWLQGLSLIVSSLVTVSCSDNAPAPEGDPIRRVFIHGDPGQLIAGTAPEGESFFEEDNLKDFANFTLSSGVVFTERSTYTESRRRLTGQGKLGLLSPGTEPASLRQSYIFQQSPGDPQELRYLSADATLVALRGQKTGNGLVKITHIFETPVELIHYSRSADGHTMSLLGRTDNEDTGKALVSVIFTRLHPEGTGPRLSETPFNFLAGKGQLYAWENKPVTLHICLPNGTTDRLIPAAEDLKSSATSLIERAWSSWVVDGKVGNKPVKLERLEGTPPPFSDVNTNCLVSVPTYARESSLAYLTTGITLPATNPSNGEISAASVLIFERAALSVPEERGYLGTLIHELGHFFGLGHEFDQGSDGAFLRSSAMAYLENRTFFPSETDLAALEELYGKREEISCEDETEKKPKSLAQLLIPSSTKESPVENTHITDSTSACPDP